MRTALKKDEKIVMVTRPHWLVLTVPSFIALGGIGMSIWVALGSNPTMGIVAGIAFALYFFYKWIDRRNNIWVVTNLRVIDEEGVFAYNTKESPLEKINNVAFAQTMWGRMLGYGDVEIQTAAEIGTSTYYMVEQPAKLKDTITQMQEDYKVHLMRLQARESAGAMNLSGKIDVAAEIEKLHDLMTRGIISEEEFAARKAKILNS